MTEANSATSTPRPSIPARLWKYTKCGDVDTLRFRISPVSWEPTHNGTSYDQVCPACMGRADIPGAPACFCPWCGTELDPDLATEKPSQASFALSMLADAITRAMHPIQNGKPLENHPIDLRDLLEKTA